MITHGNEIKLFAGNSNRPLAEAIAKKLNTELGGAEVGRFSDGETAVHIDETVRDIYRMMAASMNAFAPGGATRLPEKLKD